MKTEELIKQFKEVAEAVESEVHIIENSPDALNKALLKLTAENGDIVLAEPDDLDPGLFELYKKSDRIISDPSDQQLAGAKYGITDAFAAVARTGSVCISMSKKMGGSYSLFVQNHIAVVDAKNLVARPGDIFENPQHSEKAINRDFVFISGSSATADMGPLVRGVHGPAKLQVIILK